METMKPKEIKDRMIKLLIMLRKYDLIGSKAVNDELLKRIKRGIEGRKVA